MVITALFKTEIGTESFLAGHEADTQIVWFWLHERNRLTDGHIAIPVQGTPRVCVNWTTQGRASSIAERAFFDEPAWRETVGMSELDGAQLSNIIHRLQISLNGRTVEDAFAAAICYAITETERDLYWQHVSDEEAFRAQSLVM
ncbi:MAG: hypothetical protein AAGF55_11895 [Pseudomonadota bacterium]